MYFTPQLRNCFHVMKFVLRGQVCFEKCTLQRLSYTTRALGNHALKDDISASEKEKENCFNISGKFLLKSPYTPWSPEPASHKSHSHQHEPGGGGQGWRLASLLALSLISTKTEAEEAEKRESELIIMIKRGILALKVGRLAWPPPGAPGVAVTGCRVMGWWAEILLHSQAAVGTDLQYMNI